MSDRAGIDRKLLWLALAGALAAVPFLLDAFWVDMLVLGFISSIVVFSLNFLTGYAGLLSFGQAGFVGIGAYTYGVLTVRGTHPLLAAVAGLVAAIVLGGLLALPAARLKGHYLAIGTLGFSVLIAQLLNNLVAVTRGPMGLLGIRSFGLTRAEWYWSTLAISLGLVLVLGWFEKRTFLGVVIKAVKHDEISAKSSGIAVFAVKLIAFCVSAGLAGLAGVLFAAYMRFLTPDLFTSAESFRFLMMAVVGGSGSALGGWVAALILTGLPEALRGLSETSLRLLLYGTTVLCVLWFLPRGIGGLLERRAEAEVPSITAKPETPR
jgi:branched-chain amino acid transport system permease protein